MKESQKYLDYALKHINTADHMAYTTFSLINEQKLLLKILEQIHESLINSIYAALILKNKRISNDNKKNLIIFVKLKGFYNFKEEEIKKIIEIMEIYNKHLGSAMEFSRKENVVIMMNNLNTIKLDIKKIKEYLSLVKSIYVKINIMNI